MSIQQVRERINVVGGGGQASHLLPYIAYSRQPICMKIFYVCGGEPFSILFFIVAIHILISFDEFV